MLRTEESAIALEISRVLDRSAAAWSAGDLDAFMACYEDSPDTIYISSDGLVAGYAAIRRMYAQRFDTSSGEQALTMSLQRVLPLEQSHAVVVGRYALKHLGAQQSGSEGQFLLVFRNTRAGWRITADHTS